MMTPDSERENEHNAEAEFLTKLARLVSEYRTEMPMGHMVGAFEIIKGRLYYEANQDLKEEDKE